MYMKDSDYPSLFLANYGQSELLENPAAEGCFFKEEAPETITSQELRFGGGERI